MAIDEANSLHVQRQPSPSEQREHTRRPSASMVPSRGDPLKEYVITSQTPHGPVIYLEDQWALVRKALSNTFRRCAETGQNDSPPASPVPYTLQASSCLVTKKKTQSGGGQRGGYPRKGVCTTSRLVIPEDVPISTESWKHVMLPLDCNNG